MLLPKSFILKTPYLSAVRASGNYREKKSTPLSNSENPGRLVKELSMATEWTVDSDKE